MQQFVKQKSKGFTEEDQEQFAEHQIAISHKGHTGLGFKGKTNGTAFQGKRIKFDSNDSNSSVDEDDTTFENEKQKLNCIAYQFYMDSNLEEEASSYLQKLKPLTSKQVKDKLKHHVNVILAKKNDAEDTVELAHEEEEEENEEKPKKKQTKVVEEQIDIQELPKKKKTKQSEADQEDQSTKKKKAVKQDETDEEELPKKKKQKKEEEEEIKPVKKSNKDVTAKNSKQEEAEEEEEEAPKKRDATKKRKRQEEEEELVEEEEVQVEEEEVQVEEEEQEKEEEETEKKQKQSLKYFKRVEEDKVTFVKDELKDNTYQTLRSKGNTFADAAFKDLGKVKGKDFRAAKTKNKKKTYRGGSIDPHKVNSIKFS